MLEEAAGEGSIVISDIAYAELCIRFETQRECDAFLKSNEDRVLALTREAQFLAKPGMADASATRREAHQNSLRIF